MDRITLKVSFILAFLIALTGCQVLEDDRRRSYLQEAYKWEELIRHSDSTIRQTGYTVTAEVNKEEIEGLPTYKISNVKISRIGERESALDMFGFDVGSKSVCAGQCRFLRGIAPGQQATELALLFEQQEGAIFRFFTEWKKINREIAFFHSSSEDVFRKYLNYIRTGVEPSNSLDEFTRMFKQMLSEDKLVAFTQNSYLDLKSPEQKKAERLAKIKKTNSTAIVMHDDLPDYWEEVEKPTSTWLNSEENSADQEMVLELIAQKENELAKSHVKTDSWNKAKQLPLITGVNVCSFSDNRFGTLVSLSKDELVISIKGQAKIVKDGLIVDATSGYLFGPIDELLFTAEEEEKRYPTTDIAVCSINV